MNNTSVLNVDLAIKSWHQVEIAMPWGRIDMALAWCRQQELCDWRWQMIENSSPGAAGRYIFYFSKEQDKTAFALKWI